MTSGAFQPRRLGAHLLVRALGEDSFGTIFRSLHATDEKRFVRLRILQSPELSPPAVFSAIARHGETVAHLSHKAIVQQAELAVADGSPYYAWYEGAGFTLDAIMLRLRSAGTSLPAPFALLIAERVCAALEYAWLSPKDGEPIRHGLVWPGFVSISIDAEVRLGGFGLADAVLPSVMRGRLARDVAPYAAPEARETGRTGPASDAYSVGVLLIELLTCRRPVITSASPPFPAQDGFTADTNGLLTRCFGAPEERPSILDLHRALCEQLAASALPVSPADLAYFLYTLLNPEAQGVPTNDHESTNPISAGRTDTDRPISPLAPPAEASAARVPSAHESDPSAPSGDVPREEGSVRRSAAPRRPLSARRWISGAAYFSVAAAIILGFEGLAIHRERSAAAAVHSSISPGRASALPAARAFAVEVPGPGQTASSLPVSGAQGPPVQPGADRLVQGEAAAKEAEPALRAEKRAASDPAGRSARRLPRMPDGAGVRKAAEDARFRAAWARIEAERGEARDLASDTFSRGRGQETEGERLLRGGDHLAAREAFDRAAGAFRDANDHSRHARQDRIRISPPSS